MSDLYIFEYSNPKELSFPDEFLLPDQFSLEFEGSAMYAHKILKSRSLEEIALTMRDIDIEISRRAEYDIDTLHYLNESPKLELEYLGTCTGRYGLITLMWMFNKNDTSALKHINNLTWAEIYSIYTMGLIAYAVRDLEICERSEELNNESILFELAGSYLAEVVEASTIANILESDVFPIKKIQESHFSYEKYKESRAKSGGMARSEKYKPLEKLVIQEYTSRHTHKSNNQAAGDIWRVISEESKLDKDGRPILVEHNVIQTLSRWIAKYKRQQIPTVR